MISLQNSARPPSAPGSSNANTLKAYDYLRDRIISGEFLPGQFLSAQKLAGEIGVSRTPVREAMRQLECEELVTIVPKVGAHVKFLTMTEFQDLLGYRQALETFMAGRAATLRQPEELEDLQHLLQKMAPSAAWSESSSTSEKLLRSLAAHDLAFHQTIAQMARNAFMTRRFMRTHVLERTFAVPLVEAMKLEDLRQSSFEVYDEHVRIFEAVRDGDAAVASEAMAAHLDRLARKFAAHCRQARRSMPS